MATLSESGCVYLGLPNVVGTELQQVEYSQLLLHPREYNQC
jgi:hypothetical protein